MIKKYWAKKTAWNKFSDLIFLVLIITLLFPKGRMAVGGFINNIKAQIFNPTKLQETQFIPETDFNWTLSDIEGQKINLSTLKGKVLFINLWATWCPPCVGEMPEIQQLYDEFKDDPNIIFLMISNEKPALIHRFIERNHYSFPVLSSLSQAPASFSVSSIPTTFIVSKSGQLIVKETGAANWGGEKAKALVRELLGE